MFTGQREQAFPQGLVDLLAARTEQEILNYQDKFDEAHLASYRWDVRAAAYLIGGGCSDDSFMDFRAGLIAQGRDWYQRGAGYGFSHPSEIAFDGVHIWVTNENGNSVTKLTLE